MVQWCELRSQYRQHGAAVNHFEPVGLLSTAAVLWVLGACRLWGQSEEVRGSTVDENGRHAPCQLFLIKKEYKKGQKLPPLIIL
jgi:hypothetical protein